MSLSYNFRQRAAECIRLAQRAHSQAHHDLFIRLARAWLGANRLADDSARRDNRGRGAAPTIPARPIEPAWSPRQPSPEHDKDLALTH